MNEWVIWAIVFIVVFAAIDWLKESKYRNDLEKYKSIKKKKNED